MLFLPEEVFSQKITIFQKFLGSFVRVRIQLFTRRESPSNFRFSRFTVMATLRRKHPLHWPCFATLLTRTKFQLFWRRLSSCVNQSAEREPSGVRRARLCQTGLNSDCHESPTGWVAVLSPSVLCTYLLGWTVLRGGYQFQHQKIWTTCVSRTQRTPVHWRTFLPPSSFAGSSYTLMIRNHYDKRAHNIYYLGAHTAAPK